MSASPNEILPMTPNESSRIWRYIDFAKFVSLLVRGLYFSTLAELKRADPLEGTLPDKLARAREKAYIERVLKLSRDRPEFANIFSSPENETRFTDAVSVIQQRIGGELMPALVAVNCWQINDDESLAMWKIYSRFQGIALQSTVGRLRKCLDESITVEPVQYLDYTPDAEEILNHSGVLTLADIALKKSRWYQYEQELRAVKYLVPEVTLGQGLTWDRLSQSAKVSPEELEDRQFVKVNLSQLIECVVVAPATPSWFPKLVESVLNTNGYGQIPVRPSSVNIPSI